MKPTNLPEFKALIKRYKSITLEEIENIWVVDVAYTAYKLTGFGSSNTCTLCIAAKDNCDKCVYRHKHTYARCNTHDNHLSYDAIYNARTPQELLNAFRERAKRMEEILTELNLN